ncbi:MAG: succinyl-diaminopimelate desuccinylase [Candidatus Accumulibacter sp.]|jgi:succinyl-diaminopimelate desuccinylase|nr:succinyl-diaminopimelate desuccinylase [Accumulibacter sp.]
MTTTTGATGTTVPSDPPDERPGNPALDLAEWLIACPSVTPDEGGCLTIVGEHLRRLGFSVEAIDRGKVRNLWARHGSERPTFCFAGHVDVVPPGPVEAWRSPPFTPTRRDGFLFGRGAADMKGAIAAFLAAVESFVAEHPRHTGSLAVLLTSDEEGDAVDGTAAVVEVLRQRGEGMDFCLIGEPASVVRLGDTIKNGRRGSLSGRLNVRGVQGHIAYPRLARNPVHLVAPAIVELATTVWDGGDANFPPTSWQISNIHGGTGVTNVIPGEVELLFNFRFSTASTPESLRSRVEAILDRHGLRYELTWTLSASPFLTRDGELVDAVRRAIREELGIEAESSTDGGTSDGRFIATLCPQVVEFGPVNASIHQCDECVEIAALARLTAIYRRILEHFLPTRIVAGPEH